MFFVTNLKDEAKDLLARALARVYGPARQDKQELHQIITKIK